jgi:hypothetical protein
MLEADRELFGSRYASAIQFGFVGRGILSLPSAATAMSRDASLAASAVDVDAELPTSAFTGGEFGLDRPVVMRVAGQPRRLAVSAVARDGGSQPPAAAEDAAAGFLRELLIRRRVQFPDEPGFDDGGPIKTHVLLDEGDHLTVARVLVD